jgi:hypothetical protein
LSPTDSNISAEQRAVFLTAIDERRKSLSSEVRGFFSDAGYRPSSAAPGPRYGLCEINDDYTNPAQSLYYDHYLMSGIFIDRDPENEVPTTASSAPKTAAGQRIIAELAKWSSSRYKPPISRSMRCDFYLTAQEAQSSLDDKKAYLRDEVIETGIK